VARCSETNLRCVRSSGICRPNLNSLALIVSEISAFIRTDRQTASDPDRFLMPVTFFPKNIVYPFTLRVTGIKTCSLKSLVLIGGI